MDTIQRKKRGRLNKDGTERKKPGPKRKSDGEISTVTKRVRKHRANRTNDKIEADLSKQSARGHASYKKRNTLSKTDWLEKYVRQLASKEVKKKDMIRLVFYFVLLHLYFLHVFIHYHLTITSELSRSYIALPLIIHVLVL